MDEFQIIRRYFQRKTADCGVIVGVGDDAALLRPEPGRDLLSVVDTLVAGIHFPATLAAEDIGYRCVAVNLSDIAAMGGRPRWMTLALTMEASDAGWLDGFARGLFCAADEFGVALVGGDTTEGGKVVISIQVIGDAERDRVLRRSGARPGDGIYVTGSIGDAAAGLACLQSGVGPDADTEFLVRRFCRPAARVAFGQSLVPLASAAIDLSDGLYTDIEKLLVAGDVGGTIELGAIPLSAAIRSMMDTDDALRFALGGGDDYELGFASATPQAELEALGATHNVAVTRIGEVTDREGLRCTRNGNAYDYHHDGYRHFH